MHTHIYTLRHIDTPLIYQIAQWNSSSFIPCMVIILVLDVPFILGNCHFECRQTVSRSHFIVVASSGLAWALVVCAEQLSRCVVAVFANYEALLLAAEWVRECVCAFVCLEQGYKDVANLLFINCYLDAAVYLDVNHVPGKGGAFHNFQHCVGHFNYLLSAILSFACLSQSVYASSLRL